MVGRSINRASLKAALSEIAGLEHHPVQRVSRGRYGVSVSASSDHDAV